MRCSGGPVSGLRWNRACFGSDDRHARSLRSRELGSTGSVTIAEQGTERCWGESIQMPRLPSPAKSTETDSLFLVKCQSPRGTHETAANGDGFGDVVKKVSFPIRKQKSLALAVGIAHQKRRRYAAADAADGAI